MTASDGYTRLQIALHWLIAILIAAAFLTHEGMHKVFDDRLASGVTPGPSDGTWHTILGGLAMVMILIRVLVRWRKGAPAVVAGTPPLMARAAHLGHIALYVLMVAVPIGGATAWFGGIATVGDIHGIAGKALVILAACHGLIALYHQFYLRDGVLMRMIRPR